MTYILRLELACEADGPQMAEEMFPKTFPDLELYQVDIIDQGGTVVRVSEAVETRG